MRIDGAASFLHRFGDVEDRINRNMVLTGGNATLLPQVPLDKAGLGGHVLFHPVPTVFLHHFRESGVDSALTKPAEYLDQAQQLERQEREATERIADG